MSGIDNSGPAFPTDASPETNGGWNTTRHPGMTLRDYFAAKAMHAALVTAKGGNCMDTLIERSSNLAYQIADAMLRAREAK